MLLLKISALLNTYNLGLADVNNLVKSVSTEEEFDKTVCSIVNKTEEEFRQSWMKEGVAKTASGVWTKLLSSKYRSLVASTVSNAMSNKKDLPFKLNVKSIENSPALAEVIETTAARLSGTLLQLGLDLEFAIKSEVRDVYNSNHPEYAKAFDLKDRDYDVNPELLEESDFSQSSVTRKVTSWKKALSAPAFTPEKTRVIIRDLVDTFRDYKLESQTWQTRDFTMYESFIRTHFLYELEAFNKKYGAHIKINLLGHADAAKYTKFDNTMYVLYKDFIIKGLNAENIVDLQNTFFSYVTAQGNSVNNITPMVGYQPSGEGNLDGRASTGYRLASPQAVEKYDRLMLGFMALSNLVIALREAGVSPYKINPLIFSDRILNVDSKFKSIAQLTEHNKVMLDVKAQYDISTSLGSFKTLMSKTSGYNIVPNSKRSKTVLQNRNSLEIDSITKSITGLVTSTATSGAVVSDITFPKQDWAVNIFKLSEGIQNGINPLAFIEPLDISSSLLKQGEYEPVDDEDIIFDYQLFEKILNLPEDFPYKDFHMDMNNYDDFVDKLLSIQKANGEEIDVKADFVTFLDDLRSEGDLMSSTKVLVGCYTLIKKFQDFIYKFKLDRMDDKITYIDFAAAIYKSDIFKPLKPVVSADKDKNLVTNEEIIEALVKPYQPNVTKATVANFTNTSFKTQPLNTFRFAIKSTANKFKEYYSTAHAGMYSLTDYGVPIRLTGTELEAAFKNAPSTDSIIKQFTENYKGVKRDLYGYFVDNQGNLLKIRHKDNVVGAMHSLGYYIYTNKDVELVTFGGK